MEVVGHPVSIGEVLKDSAHWEGSTADEATGVHGYIFASKRPQPQTGRTSGRRSPVPYYAKGWSRISQARVSRGTLSELSQ